MQALHHELILFQQSRNYFRYVTENDIKRDILGWTTSNMNLPSVPFDNITTNIFVKYPLLSTISGLSPLDLHWTKDTHYLLAKIFQLLLKTLNSKKNVSVIQQNNSLVCIPFQPLGIDIVNNIKLYHGSHPMTCVMFDHESKAQHIIDCFIGSQL